MIIDSHSHIYTEDFANDAEDVLLQARALGVEKHILCNVDHGTIEDVHSFHERFLEDTFMAMGMHPTSIDLEYEKNLKIVGESLFSNRDKYVAIGEVGLDLYWDETYLEQQIKAFEQQVDWSIEMSLPLIIHTRKAYAETFSVLKKFNVNHLQGVFHCFGGGVEEARKALSMGFYLGVGGVVTYKNSNLGDILSNFTLERMMLETDAPYLPPVPYRGKRNEPKYLIEVRDKLAAIFGESAEIVEEKTSNNVIELFQLSEYI